MLRSSGVPGTEQVSTEPDQTLPQHNLPVENSHAYANMSETKLEEMRKSLETHLEILRNRLHFLETRKPESAGEPENKGKSVADAAE
jgi:E3 ubiquitin-protein ligase synoviolin